MSEERETGPIPEDGEDPDGSLSPPQVAAEEYDSRYFLHSCMGADAWRESEGHGSHPLYDGMLALAAMRSGERVLDVGTGRGELLVAAIRHGAAEAVGVDYAEAAIELAEQTLAAAGNPPHASARIADARRLPVPDSRFDLVTMLDVVEHLNDAELAHAFAEARRALRPGGRLFVHTALNPLIYEVTYRLQRSLVPSRRRSWPVEPRSEDEQRFHLNEQTPGSLRRAMRRAGYVDVSASLGRWIHTGFVPSERARRSYHRLARVPGLRVLAIADVHGTGFAPAG